MVPVTVFQELQGESHFTICRGGVTCATAQPTDIYLQSPEGCVQEAANPEFARIKYYFVALVESSTSRTEAEGRACRVRGYRGRRLGCGSAGTRRGLTQALCSGHMAFVISHWDRDSPVALPLAASLNPTFPSHSSPLLLGFKGFGCFSCLLCIKRPPFRSPLKLGSVKRGKKGSAMARVLTQWRRCFNSTR